MNCEQIQPKLLDFSREQLSVLEAKAVEEHLADCGACRELLDQEKSLDSILRDLPLAAPRTDLWPLIRSSVRGRRPVFSRLGELLGTPKRALAAGLAAATAALAIALISPVWQPQTNRTETQTAAIYQSAQPTEAWDDPMGDNTDRILAAIEEGT